LGTSIEEYFDFDIIHPGRSLIRISFNVTFCSSFLLLLQGKVSLKGFQFAQPIEELRPLTGHFGYLYSWFAFKAPEVDTAFFHDYSVDLWSLGAIIYMLLTGFPPFRGSGVELIDAKREGRVTFDIVQPSDAAQSLILSLLQVHPEHRIGIEEVLQHEWMTADDTFLDSFDLSLSLSMLQVWKDV
jgi:Protein kinase domain